MTPERAADLAKLFLPLVGAFLVVIAGLITKNVALVAVGCGGLGIPYISSDAVKK